MYQSTDGRFWPDDVIAATSTPGMLIAPDVAASAVRAFRRALPEVGLYYAVKALSDARFVGSLVDRVDGFDVASLGEIQLLVEAGVDPSRLLFSNPVKVPSHISAAYSLGLRRFSADSADEIAKLKDLAPGCDIFLRVQVADTASTFPLSSKFGVRPGALEAHARHARSAGLQVAGMSFHVGSQSTSPDDWLAALHVATSALEQLDASGIRIRTLNLGGGFPGVYHTEDVGRFDAIARAVAGFISSRLPRHVSVVAEPGRYIAANSAVMVTEVIGTETRDGRRWAHLDLGVFQGLMEPLEVPEWRYPVTNLTRDPDGSWGGDWERFSLTGPSCDACDIIGHGYTLPAGTTVGDRIVIESAGAYSLVYGSHFNGFAPPAVVYV